MRIFPGCTSADNAGKAGWGLENRPPADANPDVTVAGLASSETDADSLPGEDLTVGVTARKNWFMPGKLITDSSE